MSTKLAILVIAGLLPQAKRVITMAQRTTLTSDLVSQDAAPSKLVREGLFKPAGSRCRKCSFTTKKKGFHGRQAIRAHLKKHRREDRAWQTPFIRQSVIVSVLAVLAVTGWVRGGLLAQIPLGLPITLPLATLPVTVTTWAVFGVTIFLWRFRIWG